MSAADAQPATVEVSHGPARPRSVTVAFWLWWPQLVYQALVVSGFAVSTVFAMVVGGPALDVLLLAVPIGVPSAIVTVIGVRLLFRLRLGSRRAPGDDGIGRPPA